VIAGPEVEPQCRTRCRPISVRRPETDLVPGRSRSGFGHLRNHEVGSSEPLIEIQFCL